MQKRVEPYPIVELQIVKRQNQTSNQQRMDSMANYSTVKSYFETTLIHFPIAQAAFTPTLTDARITATYQDENYIGFEAVSTSTEGVCRHCGQVLTRFKQYRTNYLTLARHNMHKVVLKLQKKMYRCPDCKACTTEQPMKDRTGLRQSTDSCIRSIVGCLKENLSFLRGCSSLSDIAHQCGPSF